jgi:hypothetical protein
MKNILYIALAITFVVSGAALTSAQIHPTRSAPQVFRLPSGRILIIPSRPLPQLPKPATVFNTLPPWATTLQFPLTSPFPTLVSPTLSKPPAIIDYPFLLPKVNTLPPWATTIITPQNSLFPPRTLPAPSKPISIFGNPLPPKVNNVPLRGKTFEEQKWIETLTILRDGILKIAFKNQEKNTNYLASPNQSTLLPDLSLNKIFDVPQNRPASKNASPVVVVTSNLDKPAAPRVQSSPSPQLTNSGLTTNSSLKVVHITADGTAILTDGQNNYYSLPPNNVRNNQENVLQGLTKPAKQPQ